MKRPRASASAAAALLLFLAPPASAAGVLLSPRGASAVSSTAQSFFATEHAHGAERALAAVPYGLCLRNTGRSCAKKIPNASVVDFMTQCHDQFAMTVATAAVLEVSEKCNGGGQWPQGYCICSEGWCANGAHKCVKYPNEELGTPHTITVKQFGTVKQVYMAPDGRVLVGSPPVAKAAQWRVAKTYDGTYHIYTLAYPNDLLDAFDQCTSEDYFGVPTEKCSSVVGHVSKPPASQTGWTISKWNEQSPLEVFVSLRSVDTMRTLYFDGVNLDGRSCGEYSNPAECPGPFGALMFDPPLHNSMGMVFMEPPVGNVWLVLQLTLYGVSALVMCCLCVEGCTTSSKTDRFEGNLCSALCFAVVRGRSQTH